MPTISTYRDVSINLLVGGSNGKKKNRTLQISASRFFTKQGCVIAPTLFSVFFSMMLLVAFKDSPEALQRLCDCFSKASQRFGLTISIKKTEVLYQPARGNEYIPPAIFIEGQQLKAVELLMQISLLVLLKPQQHLVDSPSASLAIGISVWRPKSLCTRLLL